MKKLIPLAFALATAPAIADIHIDNAYVRATPPGAPNTAAFMTIKNTENESVKLISATSDIARSTELHTALKQDGVMKMRKVDDMSIPANGELELKPGSYHVMFIGLNQPVKEDETVMLMLNFSDGSKKHLEVPVKKPMPGMQMSHSHSDMSKHKPMKAKEHGH
ncbi:copper chaperone PCu(A)C [Motiliproteus sp. MSK22-1]|uniref:copper chaperone PCu(A)C n=1 Tax=Motiliproteus sp. MSK22-1 TaxID=1897630 RepID=UPI0009778600|nr:copper chaperone PCu(A)C [Motiliproteus sp. MSK22-1]OMH25609.1 hypothetical protein BGP75_23975 [Motiliproteus sp. MSK22-1]